MRNGISFLFIFLFCFVHKLWNISFQHWGCLQLLLFPFCRSSRVVFKDLLVPLMTAGLRLRRAVKIGARVWSACNQSNYWSLLDVSRSSAPPGSTCTTLRVLIKFWVRSKHPTRTGRTVKNTQQHWWFLSLLLGWVKGWADVGFVPVLQSLIFDEVDLSDASVAETSTKNINNSFTVSQQQLWLKQWVDASHTRVELCSAWWFQL